MFNDWLMKMAEFRENEFENISIQLLMGTIFTANSAQWCNVTSVSFKLILPIDILNTWS